VRRILCDFSEIGQLTSEFFGVGDAEPSSEPLLTRTLHETVEQLRRNDRRATRCDQSEQQHVGIDDDPQRQRP
jgi:hypothetical protein